MCAKRPTFLHILKGITSNSHENSGCLRMSRIRLQERRLLCTDISVLNKSAWNSSLIRQIRSSLCHGYITSRCKKQIHNSERQFQVVEVNLRPTSHVAFLWGHEAMAPEFGLAPGCHQLKLPPTNYTRSITWQIPRGQLPHVSCKLT